VLRNSFAFLGFILYYFPYNIENSIFGVVHLLPNEPYKRFAVITMYAAVVIAVVYIFFNFLWEAVFPFVIAYIFAECFRPIVKYSERHKKFPKKVCVLCVVFLATASVVALIYAIGRQVVLEISDLADNIKETVALIRTDDGYAHETIDKICDMIPFVDLRDKLWAMRSNLDEELWGMLVGFGEGITGGLVSLMGSAVSFLPNALFSTVVVIIATYYFAIDRVKINSFFLSLFPERLRPTLKAARDVLANTVGKYLRAYGLLFFITFGELLLAFVILGVDYSFILALVIALVDFLPVLGTGTVLIPWGVVLLVIGNYWLGIGILVTYVLITVIRQIIEPKIVGKFIGLPPIAALASMYIGLELMGLLGLFVFPLGAIVLMRVLEAKQK
ncbi:MAG: sporulation integral membrane protein YtvI, partial [Clostridia bacterium]|nr:sporulation integral membrane protein YtvI [Clostridia bacterium]